MSDQSKAQIYMDILTEEGFRPNLDKDGDVVFKFEGGNYCIFAEESDLQYFRLTYPAFWSIESAQERALMLESAASVNAQMKVTKIYPVQDDTWAAIELYMVKVEDFRHILNRSLNNLQESVRKFNDLMRANTLD